MHTKQRCQVSVAVRNLCCEYVPFSISGRHTSVENQLKASESHLQDQIQEVQRLQSEVLIHEEHLHCALPWKPAAVPAADALNTNLYFICSLRA